jgi:hypothetical protein
MPVEKVSLSLEAEVVAEARAASGGNLSAYVNEALQARARNRNLRQVLDEFEHEFPPLPPEQAAAIDKEFDDAVARVEAGSEALEVTLVRGTDLLNDHPLVEEAVIALGPLQFPVAYIVLTDEQQPIAAVVSALREHLRQNLDTGWEVRLVIVARDPSGRPSLPGVVPH